MSTDVASARLAGGASSVMPQRGPRSGPVEGDLAPGIPAEEQTAGLAHAAPASPLASLRDRIAEAEAEQALHLDLMVPRVRGVGVRFRPLGAVEFGELERRITAKGSRVPKARQQLVLNAAGLAAACLGVFVTDEAGEPIGEPSEWVKPGPALAAELGKSQTELPTAADTITELYRTEGDLMAAALELLTWSSQDSEHREPIDLGD